MPFQRGLTLLLSIAVVLVAGHQGEECQKDSKHNICKYYRKGWGFCRSYTKTLYYAFNKCYYPFEIPKRDQDDTSNAPPGHNFILSNDFTKEGYAYGVHVSGLKLGAHMYHGVFQFKVDKKLVKEANADMSGLPPFMQYRSIRYDEKPIKLVDLVLFSKSKFNGKIAKATGPLFSMILETKVRISEIIDFRRYDPSRSTPSKESYVLFGDKEHVYASHIPSACGDYQELIEIELIGFPKHTKLVKYRSIIRIDKQLMYKQITGGSRIGAEIPVEYYGMSLENDEETRKIKIKRVIFHDRCIINLLCKEMKNLYSCPGFSV